MPRGMPPTVQAMLSDYSPQVATAPLADFIPAYEADIGRHLAGKVFARPSTASVQTDPRGIQMLR